MNRLRSMWLVALAIFMVSCSMNASPEKKGEEITGTSETPAKGEVIVLTKAEFFEKVYNYEKNPETYAS